MHCFAVRTEIGKPYAMNNRKSISIQFDSNIHVFNGNEVPKRWGERL